MALSNTLLDLKMDTDIGDLVIGSTGDFDFVRDEEAVGQEVTVRCKTYRGDFTLEPAMGASLEDLIGQPNSPDTGALMEVLITQALTHDGYVLGELRQVHAFPLNASTIVAIITVEYGDRSVVSTFTLDLKEGVLS